MALSYAAGLVKTTRFKEFILATFLTNVIFDFSFAYLGNGLDRGLSVVILPFALLVMMIGFSLLVRRYLRK